MADVLLNGAIGSGLGLLLGAGAGGYYGYKDENLDPNQPVKNTIIGALAGGALGSGVGGALGTAVSGGNLAYAPAQILPSALVAAGLYGGHRLSPDNWLSPIGGGILGLGAGMPVGLTAAALAAIATRKGPYG